MATSARGTYSPTVLEGVDHASRLWREEVFAPVVMLAPFEDIEQAIALANARSTACTPVCLPGSVLGIEPARRIEAGGVMINDSSDYRFDAMPFGGSKYGSLGREGCGSPTRT